MMPVRPLVLGLPLSSRGLAWATTLGVLAVLVGTMQRDLGLFDSAELALVGRQLGLGHPTGQPLHTMLGWFFSHLPGVDPLFGLNLLSALPAALSVIPILSLAESLAPDDGPLRPAAGLTVAGFLLHPAAWEPATRVEVYALAAFFALWALARLAGVLERPGVRGLGAVGLALGLSAAANPFMAVAAGLAMLPPLLLAARRGLPYFSATGRLVAGGLLGLLPYLYILLVAHRTEVFVWEGDDLFRFFSGADYAHNRGLSVGEILGHAGAWAAAAFATGHLPLLGLGLAAALPAPRALWSLTPLTLGFCVYVLSLNAIFFADNPDYLGYLLLPTGCAAAGLASLWQRMPRSGPLVAGALLATLLVFPPTLQDRTRHRDTVARALAEPLLTNAPPRAVVYVESDHLAFPLLYLQRAEGLRPDVVVLVDGLLDSTWYWNLTYAWHPELAPIELPGSHAARVSRFFSAQGDREVHTERASLAGLTGRPVCMGPRLLQSRCTPETPAEITATTAQLGALLDSLGSGAPMTVNVLALVGLDRGELLWRQGQAGPALEAMLAGVPAELRPTDPIPDLSAAPPLRSPLPVWQAPVTLGQPARNLYVAGMLLQAAGANQTAAACVRGAALLGLPEARAAFGDQPSGR